MSPPASGEQGSPDLMKLIPSMGLYFPPLIKQAEGKSFAERCGGQRTPTPHHHVSSRRFKGREGPHSESCERWCPRGHLHLVLAG